jgi:hypothetical protein
MALDANSSKKEGGAASSAEGMQPAIYTTGHFTLRAFVPGTYGVSRTGATTTRLEFNPSRRATSICMGVLDSRLSLAGKSLNIFVKPQTMSRQLPVLESGLCPRSGLASPHLGQKVADG